MDKNEVNNTDYESQNLAIEGGAVQQNPKAQHSKLHFLCFGLGMFFLQIGWVISGNNQTQKIMEYKLNIEKDGIESSMISSSSVLGMCIGAITAAQIVQLGRRRLLLIFGMVGIVATALTLITNLWVIILGRFVFGFCTGIFMTAGPRMLDECIPTHLLGSYGVFTNIYANFGIMLCLILGAGLPAKEQDFKNDQFWRVCWGFPILSLSIGVFILTSYFREDALIFLIQQNKQEEAISFISRIYDRSENPQKVYESIKSTIKIEDNQVSFKDACLDEKYRKATWITFILGLFNQMTGLNAIMMYSNSLLENLNSGTNQFFLTASQGSFVIGIAGFIGALLGQPVISRTPRKLNFLAWQVAMGISMCLIAIFTITNLSVPLFLLICLYAILYQTSQGPLIWIYSNEVTVDSAGGLIVFAFFGMLFIQSLFMNSLMNSAIQPQGVFFIFGGITLIGAIYIAIFIKDTTGLSDRQKKTLYVDDVQEDGDNQAEMGRMLD